MFAALFMKVYKKITVQSFMLSPLCLLKLGYAAPENPTQSHLSHVDIRPEILLVKVGSHRR